MYQRILVVVSGSSDACEAVTEALALAQERGGDLVFFAALPEYWMPVADPSLLGMLPPEEFEGAAREAIAHQCASLHAMARRAGVASQHVVAPCADPVASILQVAQAQHCSLIVVASAGRNAIMRILDGSVIPGLITRSEVPVLVVRRATQPELGGVAG